MSSTHPLVEPRAEVAEKHRAHLENTVAAELRAAVTQLGDPGDATAAATLDRILDPPDGLPLYPGVYHHFHRLRGTETCPERSRRAVEELGRHAAHYHRRRSAGADRHAGTLDAAYPASCVERALAQAPAGLDRATITSRLVPWSEHLPVLDQALEVLATAWPAAHAEIETVLAEVWYLSGQGLVGFTDFTAHGAIFVSDARATDTPSVPEAVRLAESLLHEATHTVCNAAAVAHPLVQGRPGGEMTLVPTPLRADHRPLAGLMQQLVVLVRCARLYERAAEVASQRAALLERAAVLAGQARRAGETLLRYREQLTEAGATVVEAALRRVAEGPTAVSAS